MIHQIRGLFPAVVFPFFTNVGCTVFTSVSTTVLKSEFALSQPLKNRNTSSQISTCWLEDAKSETIRKYLFPFLSLFLMQLL